MNTRTLLVIALVAGVLSMPVMLAMKTAERLQERQAQRDALIDAAVAAQSMPQAQTMVQLVGGQEVRIIALRSRLERYARQCERDPDCEVVYWEVSDE